MTTLSIEQSIACFITGYCILVITLNTGEGKEEEGEGDEEDDDDDEKEKKMMMHRQAKAYRAQTTVSSTKAEDGRLLVA